MATAERTVISESEKIVCSVCIANYNGRDIIDDCLRSVLEQKCGFPYEVIVHDDASTDGYADTIAANYPQITLIRSEQNVGYCTSNNRMAAIAQGRYLLLLNNDANLQPDALEVLLQNAEHEKFPVILSLPQYDAETGVLIDRGQRLDPFFNPVPNLDPATHDVAMVIGACLWLPRSLWHELGGLPEWFYMLAEDMYLCCKARLKGYHVKVGTESGYYHRVGHSLGGGKVRSGKLSLSPARRRLSERNKTFLITLFYPSWLLFLIVPIHTLLLLLEGLALALVRRRISLLTQIYFHALAGLWTTRSHLCSERRDLQDGRRAGWLVFFSGFTLLPHKLRMLLRYGIPQLRS